MESGSRVVFYPQTLKAALCHNKIVVSRLIKSLRSLFSKKDGFLVIEILSDNSSRASLVFLDQKKNELIVVKTINVAPKEKGVADFLFLKRALRRFGKLNKYPAAIGIDSKFASTVYSSIALVRNNARDLIDEADLDNLISQAVWKFFDRHRLRVAQKLGVNDFDVLLTDVRIENIKLDGHRVLNPVGFKARTIEVGLCESFTSRTLINDLKAIMPAENIRMISESGTAWAHLVSRSHRGSEFALANVLSSQTSTFVTDEARLAYHKNIDWGEENLMKSLVEDLKVEAGTARDIFNLYLNRQTSESFSKKLERILNQSLSVLAESLSAALAGSEAKLIYLHSLFNLPELVFAPSFKNKFNFSVRLEPLTHSFISENCGFHLKFNKGVPPKIVFSAAALVLEALSEPNYEAMKQMSQMAKRRVRWLMPI